MSRSVLVSLSSCVLLALLLLPGDALAQGFTEADLVGDYAFRTQTSSDFGAGVLADLRMVGRLTADGLGGVTGSRTIARPADNDTRTAFVSELLEQTFVGTYSIEADGSGILTLEATPNPDWTLPDRRGQAVEFDRPETLRFVLADGGRQLEINMEIPGRLYQISGGFDLGRLVYPLEGQALAQEPSAPEPDPRIDVLTDLVARQSAQLCELLRLVNTPQGQRETSTPEVLDACGTGYEWNGEGTDGPRRGR